MKTKKRTAIATVTLLIVTILATNTVSASESIQKALVQANRLSVSVQEAEIVEATVAKELKVQAKPIARSVSPKKTGISTENTPKITDIKKTTTVSTSTRVSQSDTNLALENALSLPDETPEEVKELRKMLPKDLETAEAEVGISRNRFLMWTSDLVHIMWGRFGSRFFVGTDNLGKCAWGIYGNGFFAGFYDGEIFWGKYHGGHWAAEGLFGEEYSRGRYVTSPRILVANRIEKVEVSAISSARLVTANRVLLSTDANEIPPSKEIPSEIEKLRKLIPEDFEKAEAEILPSKNRYLMYTYDLKHVMWGRYGSRFFVGTDNHGKRAFGIHKNGIFVGFYDGDLFWGRYASGQWKARNLFGQRLSYGRYVLAPSPIATTNEKP